VEIVIKDSDVRDQQRDSVMLAQGRPSTRPWALPSKVDDNFVTEEKGFIWLQCTGDSQLHKVTKSDQNCRRIYPGGGRMSVDSRGDVKGYPPACLESPNHSQPHPQETEPVLPAIISQVTSQKHCHLHKTVTRDLDHKLSGGWMPLLRV
jgi:hypothetical protein